VRAALAGDATGRGAWLTGVAVGGHRAQRVDLVRLLKLARPEDAPAGFVWSAWTICEAWAERCGFFTAKAGRPDAYRAAVSILHHTGANG
jgi:hypothetical protein